LTGDESAFITGVALRVDGGRFERRDHSEPGTLFVRARRLSMTADAPAAKHATIPFKGIRGAIARKMMQSLHGSAQLTLFSEADVTVLSERRDVLKAKSPISFTEILVPAVASALVAHPHMNATIENDELQPAQDINIGMAVQTEKGLIVPVLHAADTLTVWDIANRFRDIVAAVKSGTATYAQLSGGTFTITNLGGFGIDAFTPILQTPQVGILGVGRVVERFARVGGVEAWRKFVTLSLTFDHRGIDGAPAAQFLAAICAALEKPDGWLEN
jgi:pyruvate dehydrogenase E2 component (dihydrolipoamide acetyltransferase)